MTTPSPAQPAPREILFQQGQFRLHSGASSRWKIECNSLTDDDWATLALMAAEILPQWGKVEGVPNGGLKFAKALRMYSSPRPDVALLIAEDVVTTGASMERVRGERSALGVAVFSRGVPPWWVTPLFRCSLTISQP